MGTQPVRCRLFCYLGQPLDPSASTRAWAPALDISERKDAYLVTVELPGVNADDVQTTFDRHRVSPAKKAVARLRISTSSRSLRFSRRSSASSLRSALVKPPS